MRRLILLACLACACSSSPKVTWQTYTAKDKSFTCEVPADAKALAEDYDKTRCGVTFARPNKEEEEGYAIGWETREAGDLKELITTFPGPASGTPVEVVQHGLTGAELRFEQGSAVKMSVVVRRLFAEKGRVYYMVAAAKKGTRGFDERAKKFFESFTP